MGGGSYPRLEHGITYMYWWRAWFSGLLVAGVGGLFGLGDPRRFIGGKAGDEGDVLEEGC